MKKTIKTIFCVAAFAVLAISCQKENNGVEPVADVKGTIEININGLMGEYTQVDATKAELVNTVRVSWKGDETVFVFDGTECIGSLVASLDGTEDRYALLSTDTDHTVKAPATGTTKLTLVYSPLLTEAPAVSEGAISISLANQSSTKAPFVAYATLDYNDEESINNAIVPFKFATSVIKVNCTNLIANTAIDNATLSNVNTVCKLTLSGTAVPTVAGDVNGTITRTGDEYFAASKVNAEGEAVFQIAVPVLETASDARALTVAQGSVIFADYNFTTKLLSAATSVNTVCQLIVPVPVESVSLDKSKLSIYEGKTSNLTATVYPDNATIKSVTWSSSNDDVATVDASGNVTAVSAGTAIITVTTNNGSRTATCTVTVYKVLGGFTLPGKFSVSATKQVSFSKGNLWIADGDDIHFEDNQWESNNIYDSSHLSYLNYSWFVNQFSEGGCTKISVGPSEQIYYALSIEEWMYLFSYNGYEDNPDFANYDNPTRRGKYSLDVSVCGKSCAVLAPDDFTGEIAESYDEESWLVAENAGLVCLPHAGVFIGSEIMFGGQISCYWSFLSEGYDESRVVYASIDKDIFELLQIDDSDNNYGFSVRLVADVTE